MEIDTVLSDLDGTLYDTLSMVRRAHHETVTRTMALHGAAHHVPTSLSDFMLILLRFFGTGPRSELMGVIRTVSRALPGLADSLDPDKLVELLYLVEDELAPAFLRPFAGLDDFLTGVGTSGRALGLVTSGVSRFVQQGFACVMPPELGIAGLHLDSRYDDLERTERLLGALQLHFGIKNLALVTRDDVQESKPHPEGIHVALRRLGQVVAGAAYLGDDIGDMLAAARAGVPVRIGLAHPPEPLRTADVLVEAGATHIAESLSEAAWILG